MLEIVVNRARRCARIAATAPEKNDSPRHQTRARGATETAARVLELRSPAGA